MTKEEFEAEYISRSKITPAFYHKHFVTLPCQCGADVCEGWAAVINKPENIDIHNKLYNRNTNNSITPT